MLGALILAVAFLFIEVSIARFPYPLPLEHQPPVEPVGCRVRNDPFENTPHSARTIAVVPKFSFGSFPIWKELCDPAIGVHVTGEQSVIVEGHERRNFGRSVDISRLDLKMVLRNELIQAKEAFAIQ